MIREQVLKELATVKRKLATLQANYQKIKAELAQEQGWWDKWIADYETRYIEKQDDKEKKNSLLKYVCEKTNDSKIVFSLQYELDRDYKDLIYKRQMTEGKKLIKTIAEWYKNQPA